MKKTEDTNMEFLYNEEFGEEWSGNEDYDANHHIDLRNNETLSNLDYNLNSPLNVEYSKELLECLNTTKIPSCYKDRIEITKRELVKIKYKSGKDLLGWKETHNYLSNIKKDLRRMVHGEAQFGIDIIKSYRDFKNSLYTAIGEIKPIWKGFLDYMNQNFSDVFIEKWGLIHNPLDLTNEATVDEIVYWTLFRISYLLTVLLNKMPKNDSIEEFISEEMDINFGLIYTKISADVVSIKIGEWREFLVTNNIVIDITANMIIERNLLLMYKDIGFGRWSSVLISKINHDDYDAGADKRICNIFDLGDDVLIRNGNDGYNFLALIEPMCIGCFLRISARERCDVKYSDNFARHVRSKIEEGDNVTRGILISIKGMISNFKKPMTIGAIFGSFRLWGHPYIDPLIGLKQVKENCRMQKNIDKAEGKKMADLLAEMVLVKTFKERGFWAVDASKMSNNNPLKPYIVNNILPPWAIVSKMNISWSELPIMKIHDIPSDIPLSDLYSDKSFSPNKKEVVNHILTNPKNPIKTKRVLEELLNDDDVNPEEFLRGICENGISEDELIIGLREKERELKVKGRFFTLMSKTLRKYIVLTEYLIKKYYIGLFAGITMSDGLTNVAKKMIVSTEGQRRPRGDLITFANHLDYTKWNNHQRGEAVNPVFKVMGQFLGLDNLFTLTHTFFEKSFIYYSNRPDKLVLKKEGISWIIDEMRTDYGWNGQPGGFEGVRQKGWTVCGMLTILCEARKHNTKVRTLATGDNQIVLTTYKIDKDSQEDIDSASDNNDKIMRNLSESSGKLGLIINEDETYSSTGFLVYGKNPMIFGNFINLETKKWNRVNAVSNDQLPTLTNLTSVAGATALSSAQASEDWIPSFFLYHIYMLMVLHMHQNLPLIGMWGSLKDFARNRKLLARALYIDKSIGGYTGMSPVRFLVRMFPDPVTESLCLWRILSKNQESWVRQIALEAWNPKIKKLDSKWVLRLAEDPAALNVLSGVNINMILKDLIRDELIRNKTRYRNKTISAALHSANKHNEYLILTLGSLHPVFPRFISEFKEASIVGLVESILGLLQNSKTIRNLFSNTVYKKLNRLMVKQNDAACRFLTEDRLMQDNMSSNRLCSASRADELRNLSWQTHIIGMTVPHPFEFCSNLVTQPPLTDDEFILGMPYKSIDLNSTGPMTPYLGSKTAESTGIASSWDKELTDPISKKITRLLVAIGWFISPGSKLAESILNNIESLTGVRLSHLGQTNSRTGSALHRFGSSRVSNGGFSSVNPNTLRYMFSTAEKWVPGSTVNMDFMYQSVMLYMQAIASCLIKSVRQYPQKLSFKIACHKCLREIEDILMETGTVYSPVVDSDYMLVSKTLNVVYKDTLENSKSILSPTIVDVDSVANPSYIVGFWQGFFYGIIQLEEDQESKMAALFPLAIAYKCIPEELLKGTIDGLRISGCAALCSKYLEDIHLHASASLRGAVKQIIDNLSSSGQFVVFTSIEKFQNLFNESTGISCSSQPPTLVDLSRLCNRYLTILQNTRTSQETVNGVKDLIGVGEANSVKIRLLFSVLTSVFFVVHEKNYSNTQIIRRKINFLGSLYSGCKSEDPNLVSLLMNDKGNKHTKGYVKRRLSKLRFVSSESRLLITREPQVKGKTSHRVADPEYFGTEPDEIQWEEREIRSVKDNKNSLRLENRIMSGVRLAQISTGAHYKMNELFNSTTMRDIDPKESIVVGDGSGGCGSYITRKFPSTLMMFNSLLENPDRTITNGIAPQPPSAYQYLTTEERLRCINLNGYWQQPSDITKPDTWRSLTSNYSRIDLVVSDADIGNLPDLGELMKQIEDSVIPRASDELCIVIKTYSRLIKDNNVLWILGKYFKKILSFQSTFRTLNTEELYVIFRGKLNWVKDGVKTVSMFSAMRIDARVVDEEPLKRVIECTSRILNKPHEFGIDKYPEITMEELLIEAHMNFEIRAKAIFNFTRGGTHIMELLKLIECTIMRYKLVVSREQIIKLIPTNGDIRILYEWTIAILIISSIFDYDDDLWDFSVKQLVQKHKKSIVLRKVQGDQYRSIKDEGLDNVKRIVKSSKAIPNQLTIGKIMRCIITLVKDQLVTKQQLILNDSAISKIVQDFNRYEILTESNVATPEEREVELIDRSNLIERNTF